MAPRRHARQGIDMTVTDDSRLADAPLHLSVASWRRGGSSSVFLLLIGLTGLSAGDGTMSCNDTVQVVPAPGPVVVDGRSDDWVLSAGVWSYNDPTVVDRFSVW